jgi:hypothetical protein
MPNEPRVILSHNDAVLNFIRALGLNPSLTRRIILDIPAGNVVRVYVEMNADPQAFKIPSAEELFKDVKAPITVQDYEGENIDSSIGGGDRSHGQDPTDPADAASGPPDRVQETG